MCLCPRTPLPSLRGHFADLASGFWWAAGGKEGLAWPLVLSPGPEGAEGPDGGHPVRGGGRGGLDLGRAVPGVGKSSGPAGSAAPRNPRARKHGPRGLCLQRGFEATAGF